MALHATTDAVLTAQRAKLAELTPADTPMETQRQVAREMLWHAMFTYAAIHPAVNMADVAAMCREAITKGVMLGIERGNHKL